MNSIHQDILDRIVSRRLAQLAARPVDISSLAASLEHMLHEATLSEHSHHSIPMWRRFSSLFSIAAVLLIAGMIFWLAPNGGTTVALAAPAQLARIHTAIEQGLSPHMNATTIEQANRLLTAQFSGATAMPTDIPGQVQSCCLHRINGAVLSCVLIKQRGRLITISIADAAKIQSPKGRTVTRGRRTFILSSADGVQMVMTQGHHRWLCVMGETDSDTLLSIAQKIRL